MRFLLLVALVCLTPCLCAAQERVQTIDTILSGLGREDSFSGNVLISERGRIIYEKSFGYADADARRPLTADSLFLVGSVAKTFTATAVFILKERGALALDDGVTKYLPELPYRNVTLRHLLAHTSGLPEYQSEEFIREIAGKGVDNAGLGRVFVRLAPALQFEPGSRWEYSNTNYILLALVVERASGRPFGRFVRENIFAPAGMTRSFVLLGNVPERMSKDVAAGHRFTNPLATAPVNVETLEGARRSYATRRNLCGAGNVYTTARDLLKFHHALQRGKLLKRRSLAEVYATTTLPNGAGYSPFARTNLPAKDALGWFVSDDPAGRVVYHSGGDIGFTSYLIRNTTRDQTVIVLSNIELLRHYTPTALMRILNGEPYRLDLKSVASAMGGEYNLRGREAMLKLFRELKGSDDYGLNEDEMNELGYRLLYDRKDTGAAIEVFKLNAEQFPQSFNVWDSLGEAYYQAGDRDEAVRNYEKSLRLNPDNVAGRRMLEKIRGEKGNP